MLKLIGKELIGSAKAKDIKAFGMFEASLRDGLKCQI